MRLATLILGLLALGQLVTLTTVTQAHDLGRGLQAEKPESGPSVETDHGFMVPYTEQIPGTDITFTMTPVPGGVIEVGRGGDEGGDDAENPVSSSVWVAVGPRWVATHEVTWEQYWRYMELDTSFSQIKQLRSLAATGESAAPVLKKFDALWQAVNTTPEHLDGVTAPTPLYDPSTTYVSGEEPKLPAVTMSPYAAKQFTKWLSVITGREYRLPSEAEWEHAARAEADGPFGAGAGGEAIGAEGLDDYAWTTDNSDYEAQPVGEKKPNAWGLYDTLGNAAEFVLDEHNEDSPPESSEAKPLDWADAVAWPKSVYPRIAKGGCWDAAADDCRIASRMITDDKEWKASDPNYPKSPWWFADYPSEGVGLRVVRPLEPMSDEMLRRVWEADHEEIQADVDARLEEGRGKLQSVDGKLPKVLKALDDPAIQKLIN